MDDERAPGGWSGAVGVGAALVVIVLLSPVRARALGGHAIVQFQSIEQTGLVTNPDGTIRTVNLNRQFWSQIYDLAHSMNPRPTLNVYWQLQFNGVAYQGITLNQTTPYGTFRVTHPFAGFSARYSPFTSKTGVTGVTGAEQVTTTRRNETQVSAYLSAPQLPRLDLNWLRTYRAVSGLPGDQTGITRTAQLTYDRGALNVHGGYGDIDQEQNGALVGSLQRNMNAGLSYRLGQSAARTMQVTYDYAGNRYERGRSDFSQSNTATANGTLRQSARSSWSFYGNLRQSLISDAVHSDFTDVESSLFYSLQATRAANLQAGGGVRTLRTETQTGYQRYVSGVLTGNGRVSRVWQASGSLSSMLNWDPEHPTYTINSAHGSSRFSVYRGVTLDLDALLTATSDPTAIASRTVAQTSGGISAQPLRSFTMTLSARRYQSGPRWFDGSNESRSLAANFRLRPVPQLDLSADFTNTGSLPHNEPRLRTSQINATWNASSSLRLTGYYSSSDRTQRNAAADVLRGRNISGGRVLAALSRSLILNTGVNVADPGTTSSSRQADASLTWSFGGPS